MNLHSQSRKKFKPSPEELRERLEQKILEQKTKILETNEDLRLLALRSNAKLNKIPSKDFIKDLPNESSEHTENKSSNMNDKHVTFTEEVIMNPAAYLRKFSTKESFPVYTTKLNISVIPNGTGTGGSKTDSNNPNVLTFLERKNSLSMLSQNLSEEKIVFNKNQEEMPREISLEEVSGNLIFQKKVEDPQRRYSSFINTSLSNSFSKLSMASSNIHRRFTLQRMLPIELHNNPNIEPNSGQNFSSISSISKKNDSILKENSQSSLNSLSDANIMPQIRSFIEKSRSNNESSISIKEWNLLISAVNNLKSEGSSIISAAESMKFKNLNQIEEEKM